jgi:GntR family negative regulator for fad regulon and positive regulator of fabA
MDWISAPPKPAEFTENQLIDAILEGHFPIGSYLPSERDLASQLGVTRPTLREALQRLARDGWVEIHHGKPTRVRDYWHEGNLGVLGAIARRSDNLPPDFVPNLLFVRQLLAPTYTFQAVAQAPEVIVALLKHPPKPEDSPEDYTSFDWKLHHQMTVASGNPVFTLILNGFNELYHQMGRIYFSVPAARQHSRQFYGELKAAAEAKDPQAAKQIALQVMVESLDLWRHSEPKGVNR